MNQDEITQLFDQQAANYDKQWSRMSPVNTTLHFFLPSILSKLPIDARILCVGAGTGKELLYLAERFPHWQFTAVEPSAAMLDVCKQQVEKAGFSSRCYFHQGYLDSLPLGEKHDGATCFLVSHFIMQATQRSAFFQQIANQLKPDGILVSSDLAADTTAENYATLLSFWLAVMSDADVSEQDIARMKQAYAKDVAVLPPNKVAAIISSGGFDTPTAFFQAGMIHAWFAQREALNPD